MTFRGPSGLLQFRAHYGPDRLTNVSAEQRREMGSYGGCTACGRCDRGDAARVRDSGGQYRSTMALVLAATRSMPDFAAAERSFVFLSESDLVEKERLCPAGVPFRKLAAFVADHARRARESVPASQARP